MTHAMKQTALRDFPYPVNPIAAATEAIPSRAPTPPGDVFRERVGHLQLIFCPYKNPRFPDPPASRHHAFSQADLREHYFDGYSTLGVVSYDPRMPEAFPILRSLRQVESNLAKAVQHLAETVKVSIVRSFQLLKEAIVSNQEELLYWAKITAGIILVTVLIEILPSHIASVANLALSLLSQNFSLAVGVTKVALCTAGLILGASLLFSDYPNKRASFPEYSYGSRYYLRA